MSSKHDPYPKIILSGTDPDLPDDFTNGFEKYSDFRDMARGGKAQLQTCWDHIMGRTVAIKTLLPRFADDEKERRRFLREARVTAQLQHPNTVPVYEIGRDQQDQLYFAMKRVAGEDLYEVLKRLQAGDEATQREYTVDMLLDVLIQVGQALAYAHRHGVIHRDVKPENIWVGNFGEVLLLDWGVAKVWGTADDFEDEAPDGSLLQVSDQQLETLTRQGQRPGTPLYMSPEQVLGHKYIDERTDVFSIGVVLYELLTLKEPFKGRNIRETFDRIIGMPPTPPTKVAPDRNIPEDVEQAVLKAIAKKPGYRHQSITEFSNALKDCRAA
ncbi:MAG: protein kinase [Planctomycetaceae bacterium]|nr:protein kinase [Planctomycetaceae bacterium]